MIRCLNIVMALGLVVFAGCKPGANSAGREVKVSPGVVNGAQAKSVVTERTNTEGAANMAHKVNMPKTEAEWKQKLTAEEYRVLREKGTERAFTGKYWDTPGGSGEYRCAACENLLFKGTDKFVSECGWPAFDKAIKGSIKYETDRTFGMVRTEVMCSKCGGHLGHVFEDGPEDTTGIRYCINSVSIKYTPDETKKDVEKEAISEVK